MGMREKLSGQGGAVGGSSTPRVTPDTLVSDDLIEFTMALAEGPVAGIFSGAKGFYLDDTPLASPAGSSNFSPFQLSIFHGAAVPTPVINQLGGTSSSTAVNVNLAQNTPVIRTTPGALRNLIDVIEVRLTFHQIIYASTNGDQLEDDAQFKIQYREAGTTTWNNFFTNETITLHGKTSGGYTKDFRVRVPRVNNDWEIRVIKVSPDNDSVHLIDFSWESFQSVTRGAKSYDDLAVVMGLARASDQFSSIPTFSTVLGGRIIKVPSNFDPVTRHYNGVWDGNFVQKHTDSFAWCLYDLVMNDRYGAKRYNPDLILDRYSVYELAQWADAFVPRGTTGTFQPRFTYNDEIKEARSGLELISYMLGIVGGVFVPAGANTIRLKFDQPTAIEQVFAPESVTPEGFHYQYSDVTSRPNDLTVSFINPDLNWAVDVRRVFDQSLIDRNGRITEDFTAVGCIDVYEAQRRALSRILKANTETMTVSFKTARQGVALELYSTIGVVDPDMNWGLSGRVQSVVGSVITLRDYMFLPINTNLTMSVQTPTGVQTLTVRTSVANTNTLNIFTGSYPANAPARAQFTLTSVSLGLVKPFRVLAIEPDPQNVDLFSITAQELNTNRFDDTDNMTSSGVENYQGTINQSLPPPVITSVDSGVAHQKINQDGTLMSRIEIELELPVSLTNRVRIYWRRVGEPNYRELNGRGGLHYINNVRRGDSYQIFARSVNQNGNKMSQPTAVITHTVGLRTAALAAPSGWTSQAGFDTITLRGPEESNPEFKAYKIYGATAASTTLTYLDTISTTVYVRRPPVGDLITRYKVSAITRSGVESALTGFIDVVPIPPTLTDLDGSVSAHIDDISKTFGIEALATLPVTGRRVDQIVLKTPELILYRWTGSAWTTEIFSRTTPGTLTTAAFATGITPVELVSTLPSTGNFQGRTALLTTNNKIYRFTGSVWTPEVDGNDITAGSIIAGKLAVGAVGASEIAAGAIVATKLAVTDWTNLVPDSDIQDVDAWSSPANFTLYPNTVEVNSRSQGELRASIPTSATLASGGPKFPVVPATELAWSYQMSRVNGTTYRAYAALRWFDRAGTLLSTTTLGPATTDRTNTLPVDITGTVTVPAGAYQAAFRWVVVYPETNSNVRFFSPMVRLRLNGELIVDGVITANHLASDAVTTNKLAASSVIASKVAAGTLTADKFNTTSLGVAGVSIFGNDLKSSNYSAGVSGWRLSHNGTLEIRNLIERAALVDQAVSDRFQTVATGTQTINNTYTSGAPLVLATLDIGAIARGNIFKRGALFEARMTSSGSIQVVLQRRSAQLGGGLGAWGNLNTWTWTAATSWDVFNDSATFCGYYDDFEYRLVGYGGSGVVEVRQVYLTAINLVK